MRFELPPAYQRLMEFACEGKHGENVPQDIRDQVKDMLMFMALRIGKRVPDIEEQTTESVELR